MQNKPTALLVVAAAIRDREGRLLLQQRPAHKHHGGLWEFPGGKVETQEIPRLALVREIAEELGLALDAQAMRPLAFADDMREGAAGGIVLLLYDCPVWAGVARPLEGQCFDWYAMPQAEALDLAPMDRRLLEILCR
ncbi:(deoxy)nucleoside triphosphate pyrophosphohydrolase [Tsuneonella sp. HG222]